MCSVLKALLVVGKYKLGGYGNDKFVFRTDQSYW